MANDYGYFGSGSTGYANYKQSFDRNFGGSGGGGHHNSGGGSSGCGTLLFIVAGSSSRCSHTAGNVILAMRRMLPIKNKAIACGAVALLLSSPILAFSSY